MLKKILIANRGEIACRIIRTAKKMGIKTVAVYSEADKHALHVQFADEAHCIGPALAKESYLNAEAILQAAEHSEADAIHPGYGFLSENPDFAEQVTRANLIFIGPTSEAIRLMGSKQESKNVIAKAELPVIPGYFGTDQSDDTLMKEATQLGFPLLIKSSAGGGGKGMRIVTRAEEFLDKIAACRRESENFFKDPTLILERYIQHPRHIEVQIFADRFGQVVHLFERDCSIQRRHQKVIEEAPGDKIPEPVRKALGNCAVQIGRTINYLNAGTIEFLLDELDQFYFMEMNTRLQVEHPVTEMITGIDLVEWQIRVASGEALPMTQNDIKRRGHAIEARIYAEDPHHQFLPASGTIDALKLPINIDNIDNLPINLDPTLRLDIGIQTGDTISIFYDPLMAKLIAYGEDRLRAIEQLSAGLQNFHLLGVGNNLAFLRALIRNPEFQQNPQDTGFIERNLASLIKQLDPFKDKKAFNIFLVAAALFEILQQQTKTVSKPNSLEPNSPWHQHNHWRLNIPSRGAYTLQFSEQTYKVEYSPNKDGSMSFTLPDQTAVTASGKLTHQNNYQQLELHFENSQYQFLALSNGKSRYLYWDCETINYSVITEPAKNERVNVKAQTFYEPLKAPMHGTLIQIMVNEGRSIQTGEPLMILEAMKMEHAILAPFAGKIISLPHQVGDTVEAGAELVVVEPA